VGEIRGQLCRVGVEGGRHGDGATRERELTGSQRTAKNADLHPAAISGHNS
jgi:hypothetical protein